MVQAFIVVHVRHPLLSVLALSSRFDGQAQALGQIARMLDFQYSLCRVVLMVWNGSGEEGEAGDFQYSLCRVVLMVVVATRLV